MSPCLTLSQLCLTFRLVSSHPRPFIGPRSETETVRGTRDEHSDRGNGPHR